MTRAFAVLFAFSAALPAVASAAPRRVVILNAAADQEAGFAAAGEVRRALESEAQLAPLSPGDLSRALERPLDAESPETKAMSRAAELVKEAASLVYFENKKARLKLERAERLLTDLPPTPELRALLSRLNFQLGVVHIEEQNRGLAVTAFAAARRLDPSRTELDAARYKPDIVKLFAEAGKRASAPATARARISTTFDGVALYVDGKRAGAAPIELELAPGAHYVVAVSKEYRPSGTRIHLAEGESIAETLPLERWTVEEQARRLRRELAARPGDREAVLAAGAAVTALAGAEAAVILRGGGKRAVRASIYDSGTERLSFWRPVGKGVGNMLGLLVPVPAPELPPGVRFGEGGPATPEERPWYQTPFGITGIVTGGVVLSVVGALALTFQDGGGSRTRDGIPEFP